jgi:RNA polymerase sigma-70 factor (ECF subfamily)
MDNQAFQTFCQENFGPIYRFVYKKVRNREEAEDLTSQIFLKVVSSIDRERSRQSMQQWLYLIAHTDRGPLASSLSSPNELAG